MKVLWKRTLWIAVMVFFGGLIAACTAAQTTAPGDDPEAGGGQLPVAGFPPEAGGGIAAAPAAGQESLPGGLAFLDGAAARYLLLEVSDPGAAEILAGRLSGRLLVVPALAEAPERLLGRVWMFSNGVQGLGPLGFQPDVLDSSPESGDYSPLRRVLLAAWAEGAAPRVLRSAAEVTAAAAAGELTVEASGIVVNMPLVSWPGGSR